MAIQQLSCPHCGGVFQVDTIYAGQQVSCPHCQGGVMIPADSGAAPGQPYDYSAGMAAAAGQYGYAPQQPGAYQPTYPSQFPATPETVSSLSCSVCGGLFQVTSTMAGQQVSCPHCSTVVTVPTMQPGPSMSPGTPMAPEAAPNPYSPQPTAPAPAAPGPVTPSAPIAPYGAAGNPPTSGPLPQTPVQAPQNTTQPSGPVGPGPVPEKPKPAGPKTPVPAALKGKAPSSPASGSGSPSGTSSMYPPGFKDKLPTAAPTDKTAPSTKAPATERPAAKAPSAEPKPAEKPKDVTGRPPAEAEKKAAEKPSAEKAAEKTKTGPSGGSVTTPTVPAAPATPSRPAPSAGKEISGKAADAMLPPTAASPPTSETSADSAKVDSLLPPGTATAATSGNRPLPLTPQQMTSKTDTDASPVFRSEAVGIPTDDGGFIRLKEPVKTVEVGGEEVELHRLTPEERSRRRFFKNIIMAIIGIGILIGLGVFLKSFSK